MEIHQNDIQLDPTVSQSLRERIMYYHTFNQCSKFAGPLVRTKKDQSIRFFKPAPDQTSKNFAGFTTLLLIVFIQ